MFEFEEYLSLIDDPDHEKRMRELLEWVIQTFPNLKTRVAWNQPMFTDHDTFIIAFSIAKKHIAVAPEGIVMEKFSEELKQAKYSAGKQMFRIGFDQDVNHDLLKRIIQFNIDDKKETTTFWRK
ncbi:iron chaperone [Companilactobacillus mishanensis]|uniref:Iron chaperone n=1 Tax=Companilactobacillus mishanensis TaxID=2486008 RepID=A0A5P0ZGA4_9LACO|nr:DUF1801 domain-containing protein [Companilactobacillus mishanensis]MQS52077.1 iron chaperone [Companilactobacillus mishanensis]